MDRFAQDWRTAGIDEATAALLRFAEKLTNDPATIDGEDIDDLRTQGFDDRGISSATQVVAYFNYINRIAEGLAVPMEDWLTENGRSKS